MNPSIESMVLNRSMNFDDQQSLLIVLSLALSLNHRTLMILFSSLERKIGDYKTNKTEHTKQEAGFFLKQYHSRG